MESIHCPPHEQNNVLPLLTWILLGTRMKYSNRSYLTLPEIASLLKPQFPKDCCPCRYLVSQDWNTSTKCRRLAGGVEEPEGTLWVGPPVTGSEKLWLYNRGRRPAWEGSLLSVGHAEWAKQRHQGPHLPTWLRSVFSQVDYFLRGWSLYSWHQSINWGLLNDSCKQHLVVRDRGKA